MNSILNILNRTSLPNEALIKKLQYSDSIPLLNAKLNLYITIQKSYQKSSLEYIGGDNNLHCNLQVILGHESNG